jgi:hypothetical protein
MVSVYEEDVYPVLESLSERNHAFDVDAVVVVDDDGEDDEDDR